MGQKLGISDSEFYMWRAVFSFALVDGVLSIEEQSLLQSYLARVPFSHDQFETLRTDFQNPQSLLEMYHHITVQEHRDRFCKLARALVWCEGSMNQEEYDVLAQFGCIMGGSIVDDKGVSGSNRLLPRPPFSPVPISSTRKPVRLPFPDRAALRFV